MKNEKTSGYPVLNGLISLSTLSFQKEISHSILLKIYLSTDEVTIQMQIIGIYLSAKLRARAAFCLHSWFGKKSIFFILFVITMGPSP
jgi:hypothetical protein